MSGAEVQVIRTGTANLASVLAALHRVGARPVLCDDPDVARRADRVVLPGVGAFGAARAELARTGFDAAVVERVQAGQPLLAICLGLQLLARSSEESPGVAGLGLFDLPVTTFQRGLTSIRVPQMGWNELTPTAGARYLKPGFAYFANTYKLDTLPPGWDGAWSDHGGPFVAAVERGDVLACQLHPELSGAWGARLLSAWCGLPGSP
jgi:glutamine amidotransferase